LIFSESKKISYAATAAALAIIKNKLVNDDIQPRI